MNIPLVVTKVRDQAQLIRSFDMRPESGARVEYIPGQVAILKVDGQDPAYFAFASSPDDPELEFLVKQKAGASSVIYELKAGDRIELAGIAGHGFDLAHHRNRDLVFVAMGTGVAPLRSALRHVLKHRTEFGKLVVLYGARTPQDFCYAAEVQHWADEGVELRQVISRPDGHDWFGPTGYVQSLLDNVLPELSAPVALTCGSREMIDQTRERLGKMGFQANEILTNY